MTGDLHEYTKLTKAVAELEDVVQVYQEYQNKTEQLLEAQDLVKNAEGGQVACTFWVVS